VLALRCPPCGLGVVLVWLAGGFVWIVLDCLVNGLAGRETIGVELRSVVGLVVGVGRFGLFGWFDLGG
jgi:hypothetical protein